MFYISPIFGYVKYLRGDLDRLQSSEYSAVITFWLDK